MQTLIWVIVVYLILNSLIWIVRHATLSRAQKKAESLDSHFPLGRHPRLPKVSILVAGKNEERNIERCLRSLLNQNYPDLEVIAINDRSTDRTAEIMDSVAANAGGRLKVLHIKDLPAGWLGKPHAMYQGQKIATGEYLIFTDADCFFQCPDAVRIAVEFSLERKTDLLSVLPVLETPSFWERVLQPVCSAVLIIWFRPEWVNDPAKKVAYANGAFMLFTRDCYDKIGGHPSAKEYLMEDMKFARLVKAQGMKLYVVQNRDLYRTRMYDNFTSSFNGWARIFYGGFQSVAALVLAALMLLIVSLFPYYNLIGALGVATIKGWDLSPLGWHALAWSGVAIAAQLTVLLRFYEMSGTPWYRAFTYPLGATVTFFILLSSLKKYIGGKIVWRGSEIKHSGGKGVA